MKISMLYNHKSKIIVFFLLSVFMLAIGATIGVTWNKTEVTPIVLVEPGIGGFRPIEGNSIGNIWSKSEVKPVLLVKQSLSGYVPREGSSIGNLWARESVVPVVLVESSMGTFIPLSLDEYIVPENTGTNELSINSDTPSVFESKVDGDFEGWEGETIVKLMNGQIWQQTEYYYKYSYSYMPDVLIYMSGETYKMRVEGIERAVGVTRLK